MILRQRYFRFILFVIFLMTITGTYAQSLELVSSNPSLNEVHVSFDRPISLLFDDPLDITTANADNIIVRGSQTGVIEGTYNAVNNFITFTPSSNYKAGEVISVTITERLSDDTGSFFRFGHTLSFTVSAPVANDLEFVDAKVLIGPTETGENLNPIGGIPLDIDNDGDVDLLGASQEISSLYWFENDGSANFTTQTVDDVIAVDGIVGFSDFDNDGDSDVLVYAGEDLFIYSNGLIGGATDSQGVPLFSSIAIFNFDEENPNVDGSVVNAYIADFDNDGYEDIWYVTSTNAAYILYDDGAANFTAVDFPLTSTVQTIGGVRDLNADGFLDLVLSVEGELTVWSNNKDRTFAQQTAVSQASTPEGFSFGDLNGDNFPDMFVTGGDDRIVFNNGDFTFFEIPLPGNENAEGTSTIADVNADGLEDLIFQAAEEKTKVYLNDGASGFNLYTNSSSDSEIVRFLRPTGQMFRADLDGDNDLEIMGSSARNSAIFFLQDDVTNTATLSLVQQGNETTDIELEVELVSNAMEDITFSLVKTGGSAEEGVDFESLVGKQVMVAQGTRQASVIVDVYEDAILESSEDVFLSLATPNPSTVKIIKTNVRADIEDSGALRLVSRSPVKAARQIANDTPIVLTFSMDVVAATVNAQSVRVFGKYGGELNGTYTTVGNTVTFTPDPNRLYFAGERVTVNVSEGGVQSVNGGLLNKTTMSYFDVATDFYLFSDYDDGVVSSTAGGSPRSALAFDYDDDGDIDFFRGMLNGRIEENRNNGDGTFTSAGLNTNDGLFVSEIETFDFENDGDTDFIAASSRSYNFDIFINDGEEVLTFDATTNRISIPIESKKVTVYDLNADGFDDLIFSGHGSTNVSFVVAKNIGGTSMEIASFGTGISSSTTHVILDVNFDGLPDILLNEGGTMVGYLNAENFNFTLLNTSPLLGIERSFTEYIGVFDFDNDGDEDIAVRDNQNVGWLINQGDRWEERIHGDIDFDPSFGVRVGDMNGDGDLDFVAANFDGFAVLLANDSQGTNYTRIYEAAAGTRSIIIADFDNDNRLDPLVIRQKNGIKTSLYFPNRIVAHASIVLVEDGLEAAPVTGSPRAIEYALRLSAPNTTGSAVTFDISDAGTGTATSGVDYIAIAPNTQLMIEPGESEVAFFVEVINDDDVSELETVKLTISNSSSTEIPITGDSATGSVTDAVTMVLTGTTPVANATITQDQSFLLAFDNAVDNASNISDKIHIYGEQSGPMDYTVSGLLTRDITLTPVREFFPGERVYLSIEENLGNGASTDEVFLLSPYSAEYVVGVTPFEMTANFQTTAIQSTELGGVAKFVDIDDDEDLDVIAFGNGVYYMLNDGLGNYAAPVQLVADTPLNLALRGGTIFDMDNDGDLDIVTSSNADLFSLINPGDITATWTTSQTSLYNSSSSTGAGSYQHRDIDGDGDIDVVATLQTSDKVMLYLNDGIGNFTAQVISSTSAGSRQFKDISIGDMNNDGRPDLITSEYRNHVWTFYNNGSNSFSKVKKDTDDVTNVSSLIDFDNDGDLDIAFGNYWSAQQIRWLRNNGNSWGSLTDILRGSGRPNYMKALDVNGDAKVDLLSVSGSDDSLTFVLAKEGGSYSSITLKRVDDTNTAATYVDVGDIDGDGVMEILSISSSKDEILIHKSMGVASIEVLKDGIEGSQDIELKVSLNNPNTTGVPVTFDIAEATGGTATNGVDFQDFDEVSIPDGESFATITITVVDDTEVEIDETLVVELSNSYSPLYIIGSTNTATANIASEDLVTADLSVSVHGNEEGLVPVEYTVTLSEPITSDVSFDIRDSEIGTATRGEDYGYLPENATITVLAGETTGTISVEVLSDNISESYESLTLMISNPSLSIVSIAIASVEGTIANFGGTDLEAVFSLTTTGDEGVSDIEVAVLLSIANPSFTDPIVFDLEDLSELFGSAVAGEDYSAIQGAQISIPAGQDTGIFTIFISDDQLVEIEETVFLNISVNSKPFDVGEVTITNALLEVSIADNDQFNVELSANSMEESEQQGVTFTATLNTPNETGTVLVFDIMDTNTGTALSGTDYTAFDESSQIRIAEGARSGTFMLDVVDDADLETDETVALMIANSASTNAIITTASAVGTIIDDEELTATLKSTKNGKEEGMESAEFSLQLNGYNFLGAPIQISFEDVTEVGFGKAISGTDYTLPATTVTVNDGSNAATFSVAILADTRLEGTETFTLQLNPTEGVIVSENGRVTASIEDNVATATAMDVSLYFEQSVGEGELLVAAVSLSAPNTTGAPITIDIVDTSAGTGVLGSDYEALTQTQVNIPNNERQAILPVVTLSDDDLDGDKEIELQISNPSTALVNIISDRATGTILDATEATADLGVVNQIFDESGDLIYEVTLSKLNQSGSSLMFDLVDTNFGSASKGVDYVEIPEDAKISIPHGQSTGTYAVSLIDDLQIENDETIELQISNPSLGGMSISSPIAMGTITDNDVASLQVSTQELEVSESGPLATFTVVLDVRPPTTVVVSLLVEDASEIATDVSRLIFTPENWNIPQMVVVNGLDDELADGDVVSSIAVSIEDSLSDYSFRSLESHMVSVTNLDNEVLSIDDFDINGITYFPNPVKEVLFLESKIAFENLSIYNILGQEIYKLDGAIKRIDMSKFQAGVYFLKINIEDTTRTIRITKE
jgi:hypothetical protein